MEISYASKEMGSGVFQDVFCVAKINFSCAANRVVNNVHVDFSDAGVPYTEARSHCRLSDLISDPSPSEFIKFLGDD